MLTFVEHSRQAGDAKEPANHQSDVINCIHRAPVLELSILFGNLAVSSDHYWDEQVDEYNNYKHHVKRKSQIASNAVHFFQLW